MKREIHIYDLDGTVIDSSHRYRTVTDDSGAERIDLAYWLDNAHRATDDTLLPLADQLRRQLLDPTIAVIVATARQMREADWAFIDKHFGRLRFDGFISRKIGDNTTKGADMKIAGIKNILNALNLHEIKTRFFYEDNLDYLHKVAEAIDAEAIHVKSNQGH